MGTHTLRDSLNKPVPVPGEWFPAASPCPFKGRHPTDSLYLTGPQGCSDLLPTGVKGALGRGQDLWQPLGFCFPFKQTPIAFITQKIRGGGGSARAPTLPRSLLTKRGYLLEENKPTKLYKTRISKKNILASKWESAPKAQAVPELSSTSSSGKPSQDCRSLTLRQLGFLDLVSP